MPWETFKRQRVAPGQEPTLTIQKKGIFSLNHLAYEALGKPQAVEMLYDPDERLLGLRKTDEALPHAYVVRNVGRGNTWLVSGTAFTHYYGIETSVPTRRNARLDGDLLIVDLKDEGVEVQAHRRTTRRAPQRETLQLNTS